MSKMIKFVPALILLSVVNESTAASNNPEMFQFSTLKIVLIVLIVLIAVIAILNALRRSRDKRAGIAVEDELSLKIKYKSGYQAYLASMYMWLFIFFFKEYFPNTETMLGGGILLSALIGYITKIMVKQKIHEE
ncbi:MAG: hypothetical protein R3182_00515 [Draconibacterium sp.]|nr:hypothetical protein [Draconibacterium sp.]